MGLRGGGQCTLTGNIEVNEQELEVSLTERKEVVVVVGRGREGGEGREGGRCGSAKPTFN